jgi:cell division protein ZapE
MPLDLYHDQIAKGVLFPNADQKRVVEHFAGLCDDIQAYLAKQRRYARWQFWKKRPMAPRGVYVVGDVGTGKTAMMDLFCQSLPKKTVYRQHFHAFMHDIHDRLRRLSDQKDPLKTVAQSWEKPIVCLDEFLVQDIADAMILKELFSHLFHRGLVLITTSNTLPEDLYKHGLQRDRFLPFIPLLQDHCQVLSLNHDQDYRLRHGPQMGAHYLYPLTEETQTTFAKTFETAIGHDLATAAVVFGEERSLILEKASPRVAWTTFMHLCGEPRGTRDYQRLCDAFTHIFIDHVPCMSDQDLDQVKRLILLIDCLYDRGITLTMRAAAAPRLLYQGTLLSKDFSRTASRLIEMAHPKR